MSEHKKRETFIPERLKLADEIKQKAIYRLHWLENYGQSMNPKALEIQKEFLSEGLVLAKMYEQLYYQLKFEFISDVLGFLSYLKDRKMVKSDMDSGGQIILQLPNGKFLETYLPSSQEDFAKFVVWICQKVLENSENNKPESK